MQHLAHVDRLDHHERAPDEVDAAREHEQSAQFGPRAYDPEPVAHLGHDIDPAATSTGDTAAGPIRNGRSTSTPTRYVTAFTTNAPSTPNDAIDTAASSGPNAIADCDAVESTPLAAASRSSPTMRGGRAWNAGSENALVIPSIAPNRISAENEPARRNSSATPAARVSAITITRFGPSRSTGTPAIGPSSTAGSAHASPSSARSDGPASKRKLAKPHRATSAHQLPIALTAWPNASSAKRRSRSRDIRPRYRRTSCEPGRIPTCRAARTRRFRLHATGRTMTAMPSTRTRRPR